MATAHLDYSARRLCLNPHSVAVGALKILVKIVSNVLASPLEPKFRSVPAHNAKVKAKLLEVAGGREALKACGFEPTDRECELFYVLRAAKRGDGGASASAETARLASAKAWFEAQLGELQAAGAAGRITVDARLVLRLPGGRSVELGFRRGETLREVRDFTARFLLPAIAPSRVVLATALAAQKFAEDSADGLDVTLDAAQLLPKAVLFVSVEADAAAVAAAAADAPPPAATQHEVRREEARRREEIRRLRVLEKKRADDAVKNDRARTLREFQEHRQVHAERAERKRVAAAEAAAAAAAAELPPFEVSASTAASVAGALADAPPDGASQD